VNEYVTQGHLGGYVVGGDEATWYPDLWLWLVQHLGVRSVLDVGCGEGHAVDFFTKLDVAALGIDGIPQEHAHITQHDFTEGPWVRRIGDYYTTSLQEVDLVWCCEFVEHVEEQYIPNFIEAFKLGKFVLMTHAAPGQAGYHHVNCQPSDYWVRTLSEAGFLLDIVLTTRTRAIAARNPSPWNHYARSGLAFRRGLVFRP